MKLYRVEGCVYCNKTNRDSVAAGLEALEMVGNQHRVVVYRLVSQIIVDC